MSRSPRRFPFKGLLLIGLGFFLATMLSGGGGAIGGIAAALLFIPLLMMKMLFIFFLFGMAFRFAGAGGRGPWGNWGSGDHWGPRHRGPRGRGHRRHADGRGRHGSDSSAGADDGIAWRYRGRPMPGPKAPAPAGDQAEWEESLRAARAEVDDIDAPYRKAQADVDEARRAASDIDRDEDTRKD